MKSNKVLIVEDDKATQEFIRNTLDMEGAYTCIANDGEQALDSVRKESPDLVLLDLRLPGIDGFSVCEKIRKFSNIPLIAISGIRSVEERERFINIGGNDYITKPFTPEDLIFRLRTNLRKAQNSQLAGEFTDGHLNIDFAARSARIGERQLAFSETEFKVLHELIRRNGECVTFNEIRTAAWGNTKTTINTLYLAVCRIREKLGKNPDKKDYIANISGVGYRFNQTNKFDLR